jgi:hypothetical protein
MTKSLFKKFNHIPYNQKKIKILKTRNEDLLAEERLVRFFPGGCNNVLACSRHFLLTLLGEENIQNQLVIFSQAVSHSSQ